MRKTSRTRRGDIMRRIAALHAKAATLGRDGRPIQQKAAEREELKKKIAALTEQMMTL